MPEYFSGRVHTVVFSNAAQDFYILRMALDRQEDDAVDLFGKSEPKIIAVRGNVPGMSLAVGSWFGFEARWENHAKFGPQLVITKAPVIRGKWTTKTACSLLTSHGVGPQVVRNLESVFGDQLVQVLDDGDEKPVLQVPGITPFAATHVISRWKVIRAYFQTLDFLAEAKVPKSKVSQVWSHFGDQAVHILSSDPWALVQIDGITFGQADEVAMRLGLDMSSPLRIRGGVLYSCKDGRGMGHLFLSSGEMLAKVQSLISGTDATAVATALADLHKAGDLVVDRKTKPGMTAIYEPWLHQLEVSGARLLHERMYTAEVDAEEPAAGSDLQGALRRLETPYGEALSRVGTRAEVEFKEDPKDIVRIATAALEDWSQGAHISLSDLQMAGALNALTAPVSILTGLPGTGKTTTLQAVVSVLQDAGVPFLLTAPTGIAAKRMSTLTGATAATIHRAFGAQGWATGEERESTYAGIVGSAALPLESSDGSGEQWKYGPDRPHPAKVVIIDEFSMVDQHLLYRLLTCTEERCRLVFVGDAAQLPSVGPGNVLRDVLNAKLFPTIALTEIFRQAETSDIVIAAHAIHRGDVPKAGVQRGSDFVFLEVPSEEDVLSRVVDLARRLYGKRRNFQILSPRHGGTIGVTNHNQRLREIINPKGPMLGEMRLGSEVVREGDRVMVVKNNYDMRIFNGDVGKVARLDRKAQEVVVKLHGPPEVHIRIPFKSAPVYLRLAYAMTVHKSQGMEYDVIVMPLVKSLGRQLQRNLFYTAITRARERVFLVGHREAMVRAVLNDRVDVRNTLFPERLLSVANGGS
jgi:exodeoxyribonuclease V alpha subunit